MPKRSVPHGQPRRKRGRRRRQPLTPTAATGDAPSRSDAASVAPFPAQARTEGQRLQSRLAQREHHYVGRELARIAVIAVAILILLAILTFVL